MHNTQINANPTQIFADVLSAFIRVSRTIVFVIGAGSRLQFFLLGGTICVYLR